MEAEIVVALIGLTGVSLGALLGGIGYFLKSRTERMKNKRVVLFYLLEFRHQVVISDIKPKDFVEEYLDICNSYFKKIGLICDDAIPDDLRKSIETFITNLLNSRSPKIDGEFVGSYESALKNLCSTDPILAYKLRGMESFYQVIDSKERYITELGESIENSTAFQLKTFLNREVRNESDSAIEELIKNIEKDILKVSYSCGFFTWFLCLKIFRNKPKFSMSSNKIFIEKAIDTLLVKLHDEITRPKQSPSDGLDASS